MRMCECPATCASRDQSSLVLQGEYADAAFSEVVSKSLANTVNFGEAIVLGRRCSLLHKFHAALPSVLLASTRCCAA
jgi:hypothetical protein